MTRFVRRSTLPLAALLLAACGHWQPRLEGPREALTDPEVRHVRLTRTNREQVEMRVAEVRGDSIYGTLGGSGPLACTEASTFCNVRMPISEVGFLEVRAFSAVRTASLVVIPVAALALVFLVDEPCSPLDGPC